MAKLEDQILKVVKSEVENSKIELSSVPSLSKVKKQKSKRSGWKLSPQQ